MLPLFHVLTAAAFVVGPPLHGGAPPPRAAVRMQETVSPFSKEGSQSKALSGPLPLTLDNVEAVLDEMRPYLLADGGNVAVQGIDGGVVRLELQGACGSCPSSSMTMRMGLERGLREKIPEIVDVEQVEPDGPQLTEEGVEGVLDEIRPFIKMAGGTVRLRPLALWGGRDPGQ